MDLGGATKVRATPAEKSAASDGAVALEKADAGSAPANARDEFLESRRSPRSDRSTKGATDPTVTRIIAQDPKMGEVIVFAQIHMTAGTRVSTVLAIGDYQAKMLSEMNRRAPKHIFDEGRQTSLEYHDSRLAEIRLKIGHVFRDGVIPSNPAQLTDYQKIFLARHGAAKIYAALHSDVKLHRVISEAENKDMMARLEKVPFRGKEWDRIVRDEREHLAMKHVQEFLSRNPDVTDVAVVYGAAHKWGKEDFPDKKNIPTVTVLDWPESHSTDNPSWRLGTVKRETEQLKIIEQAHALSEDSFLALGTERAQLAALPKLEGDPRKVASVEELRDQMIAHAGKHASVVAAINELFEARTGPFKAFYPSQSKLEKFDALPLPMQSRAIEYTADVATQSEIVRRASFVDVSAFQNIFSFRAMREALPKLHDSLMEMDAPTPEARDALALALYTDITQNIPSLGYARDLVSKQEYKDLSALWNDVETAFKDRTGPFASFK